MFKSYNSAPTKLFTAIEITVIFLVPSTTIGTHFSPIDVSIMIRQRLILQEEKDRHNSLGLYCYCGKLGHIAIYHKNPALLATKRQAASAFTDNLMALVPYKPLFMEEKKTFLG